MAGGVGKFIYLLIFFSFSYLEFFFFLGVISFFDIQRIVSKDERINDTHQKD